MRAQAQHRTSLILLGYVASLSTILVLVTVTGCGSGSNDSEASVSRTVQDFTVSGDASLSTRAVAKGLMYGAAVETSALTNPHLANAFAAECSILVPEWELKWKAVHPTPDTYDFSAADSLLNFAQRHNMLFRGHTLVWHTALPSWFESSVTTDNAEQILRSHVATVVGRYAGKIHSWDVVNEAVSTSEHGPDGLRVSSPWYKLLGPRYIGIAFRAAAQADPNAILVYNDNGLDYDTPEADAKREAVLKLLRGLKVAGVPVHALGVQAHLYGSGPQFSADKLRGFLRDVAALGLKIFITEMDVKDQHLPSDISTRDQIVAGIYSEYLTAALSEPAVVAVLTWGLSDCETWISGTNPRRDGLPVRPLPLDKDMKRKPAWHAIAKAVESTFPR